MLDKLSKKTPQSLRLTEADTVITVDVRHEKSCNHASIICGNIVRLQLKCCSSLESCRGSDPMEEVK